MQTEKAFLQSINEHQKIIHKVCNLYMHTPQDKEDLFQEIVLNAWKGIQNFKGESKFSTWLYRVALNTAITFFKKEIRKPVFSNLQDGFDVKDDIDKASEEDFTALNNAILSLSKIDKALVMLYLEDYSYHEIGELMGITANNVAVKLSRIKARLKEDSQKYYQTT